MSRHQSEAAWRCNPVGLYAGAKLVLLSLADHHNHDTGKCNPSRARLAERTGLDRRSISRALHYLEAAGLVSVRRRDGQGSNYVLTILDESPDRGHGVTGDTVSPVTPCQGTGDITPPPPGTERHRTGDKTSPGTGKNRKEELEGTTSTQASAASQHPPGGRSAVSGGERDCSPGAPSNPNSTGPSRPEPSAAETKPGDLTPAPTRFVPQRRPAHVEEVVEAGRMVGVAEQDARDWFRDCSACGWSRGDGSPFANWRRELVIHRDKLAERRARMEPRPAPSGNGTGHAPAASNGAQIVAWTRELDVVNARMKSIRDSYDAHVDFSEWSDIDKANIAKLKARAALLKQNLKMEY